MFPMFRLNTVVNIQVIAQRGERLSANREALENSGRINRMNRSQWNLVENEQRINDEMRNDEHDRAISQASENEEEKKNQQEMEGVLQKT